MGDKCRFGKRVTATRARRKHPLYVLKRHIGKYRALQPGTRAAGVHRGEPFYNRDAIVELHTAEQWRRNHQRDVRPEELAQPAKIVPKKYQGSLTPCGRKSAGIDALDNGQAAGGVRRLLMHQAFGFLLGVQDFARFAPCASAGF